MKDLRVAAVQFEARTDNKDYNLGVIESFAREAAADRASVVSFHECSICGYMNLEKLSYREAAAIAEPVPGGESIARLKELAAASGIYVMAGLLEIDEKVEGKLYNTYVSVSPDGTVNRHRKLHPFVSPFMQPGTDFKLWDIEGWKAGCLICFDCNIFENWRILELAGVQVVFAPHMTGGFDIPCAGMGKIPTDLWKARRSSPEPLRKEILGPKGRQWLVKWLPSRAYDTGTYVVYSNGVGIDGDEVRTGNSMIIDPHGVIIAETNALDDDMIIADLKAQDLDLNLGRMHTASRRPELYGPLTESSGKSASTREMRNLLRRKLGAIKE